MEDTEPVDAPIDEMHESTELGDSDERVDQESGAGKDNIRGGGEYPDPHTGPSPTAAGSAGLVESPELGHGQFQEAYDADPERAAVGAIAPDRVPDDGGEGTDDPA